MPKGRQKFNYPPKKAGEQARLLSSPLGVQNAFPQKSVHFVFGSYPAMLRADPWPCTQESLTSGGTQEIIWSAKDPTQVRSMQGKCSTCLYYLSLQPLACPLLTNKISTEGTRG